jgi:hypothetical protein
MIAESVVKGMLIVIVTPDPVLTGYRLMQSSCSHIVPIRTTSAPSRHVYTNEVWIYRLENIVSESQAFHGRGAVILYKDITGFNQPFKNLLAFRFVEINAAAQPIP